MSQQSILTAIYEKINPATSSGTVFKTAFGGTGSTRGRIFQEQAAQDTALPLAVFAVTEESTTAFFGETARSLHECTLNVTMYFRPNDGIATAMASDALLYSLLHMTNMASGDSSVASIRSVCVSRGKAEVLTDSISIDTTFRLFIARI